MGQIQRYTAGNSNLLGSMAALVGIILATAIFTVRQWNPPVSVSIDVASATAQETNLRLAQIEREQADKMQHLSRIIHTEMAGLSMLFAVVLVFAFRDTRLPRWSRDILLMCAGVIAVGCFTRW